MHTHELAEELELYEKLVERLKREVSELKLALKLVQTENDRLKTLLAEALA